MVVNLNEKIEIVLSDPGKFHFSGLKYCACLITANTIPIEICYNRDIKFKAWTYKSLIFKRGKK